MGTRRPYFGEAPRLFGGPSSQASCYNRPMVVAIFLMRLLEVMFFVGLAGSAVVVLISFVEDFKELFGED
jgi:hypothetical protein